MDKRKFWLWVDGQKRWYDYPPEPPGYTVEQWQLAEWLRELTARQKQTQQPHDGA